MPNSRILPKGTATNPASSSLTSSVNYAAERKPESVFQTCSSRVGPYGAEPRDFRTAVQAIQGASQTQGRFEVTNRALETSVQDENDSDSEEGSFSTDSTFNLLSQFVSALAVAVNAGWQIFDDG
jgi:hypothetical protein